MTDHPTATLSAPAHEDIPVAPTARDITVHDTTTMWGLSDHLPVELTIALTPSVTEGEL
ncbi:hypothetical protein ABZ502_16900 [Streptomyces abikoensis]|uniref:hypothetical protein n=1 Tax=Streptomyces abikoensis TaxID=97398 RepID=UPI0033FFFE60